MNQLYESEHFEAGFLNPWVKKDLLLNMNKIVGYDQGAK